MVGEGSRSAALSCGVPPGEESVIQRYGIGASREGPVNGNGMRRVVRIPPLTRSWVTDIKFTERRDNSRPVREHAPWGLR